MLTKEELKAGLYTQTFGKKLYIYSSIDSTNACAKVLAGAGIEEGTVVFSEHQTAGRGRQGRTWQSEPGANLLFSFVIRPKLDINKVALLTFYTAASISVAIEKIADIRCQCKWPNDLLLNGKKFCGILMESTFQQNMLDYAVVGIGINVNQKSFSEELKNKATSLKLECNKEFDRIIIFQNVMRSLESAYTEVSSGNFEHVLNEWKNRASVMGKQITLIQGKDEIHGRASGIAADGGLIIVTPSGERTFYSGDLIVEGNSQA